MIGRHTITRLFGPAVVLVSVLALAACGAGTSTAAAAVATPACAVGTPRAGATTAKTVTGTVTTLAAGTMTLTSSTGTVTNVQYSTTTRFSHLQTLAASSLTSGTSVMVITKASQADGTTVAQSIIVQTAGSTGGFGGGNGGQGGNGTPTSGNGTPRTRGCRPANTQGFRGINGTVSAFNSGTQLLTVTDAQGATFLITVAPTTTIATTSQGTVADLKQGEMVTVRGTLNGTTLVARQIQVLTTVQ